MGGFGMIPNPLHRTIACVALSTGFMSPYPRVGVGRRQLPPTHKQSKPEQAQVLLISAIHAVVALSIAQVHASTGPSKTLDGQQSYFPPQLVVQLHSPNNVMYLYKPGTLHAHPRRCSQGSGPVGISEQVDVPGGAPIASHQDTFSASPVHEHDGASQVWPSGHRAHIIRVFSS